MKITRLIRRTLIGALILALVITMAPLSASAADMPPDEPDDTLHFVEYEGDDDGIDDPPEDPPPPMLNVMSGYGTTGKFLAPIGPVANGSTPISNRAGLEAIASDFYGTYHLTNNIDLSTGGAWTPIDYFDGVFDGQGYTIQGMTITGDREYNGLFVNVSYDAVVKNIGIENANINVTSSGFPVYAGGICGMNYGIISNCYFEGNIVAGPASDNGSAIVGGISGTSNFGVISDCYNAGSISASAEGYDSDAQAGGIVGSIGGQDDIRNCLNSGTIDAVSAGDRSESYAGGIGGHVGGINIGECYNSGSVSASSEGKYVHAYAGGISGNNIYDSTIRDCGNEGAIEASSSGAYAISEAGGICGYNYYSSLITGCDNSGSVSAESSAATSFESYYPEASAGGICGTNEGSTVNDSRNTGTISASSYSEYNNYVADAKAGGICGVNKQFSTISKCYNTGAISSSSSGDFTSGEYTYTRSFAGGICGWNHLESKVLTCYNVGSVSSYANSKSESTEGAFAGGICGESASFVTVSNCFNAGAVSSTAPLTVSRAGGISGQSSALGSSTSVTSNCYNVGAVNATGATVRRGGIVGNNAFGSFSNCYAVNLHGSTLGKQLSASAMKLQSSFTGFNFSTIWAIDSNTSTWLNNGYPYLRDVPVVDWEDTSGVDTPANLKAAFSTEGAGKVTLSWGAVSGASEYKVFRKLSSEPDTAFSLIGTVTTEVSYHDLTAEVGVAYSYAVTAKLANGKESQRGDSLNVTIAQTLFKNPGLPAVAVWSTAGVNPCIARVSWAKADDFVTKYHIYRTDPGSSATLVGTVAGNILTWTDPNALPLTAYIYQVVAVWEGSGKPDITTNSQTRALTTPALPALANLKGSANGPTGVKLTWNASVGAAFYEINYESGGSSPATPLRRTSANESFYEFNALVTGAHAFTVRPVWKLGNDTELRGNWVKVTASPATNTVTGFSVSATSPHTAKLVWSQPTTGTRIPFEYDIMRSDEFTSLQTKIATIAHAGSPHEYKDDGIVPGRAYYYSIIPIWKDSETGDDKYKGIESSKLTLRPAMHIPTGLKAAVIQPTSVELNWPRNSSVDAYRVYFAGNTYDVSNVGASNPLKLVISDLHPNTTYFAYVSALWDPDPAAAGPKDLSLFREGTPGAAISIRTTGAAPAGLSIVTGTLKNTEVKLKWNAVANASGYKLYKNGEEILDLPVTGTEVRERYDLNLKPGTAVRYTVQAYFTIAGPTKKLGALSAALTVTPPGAAPASVRSVTTPTSINVQWNAVTNAAKYRVYFDDVPYNVDAPTLNQIFVGLDPESTHQVRVVALFDPDPISGDPGRFREGNSSATFNFKAAAAAPGNFVATNITNTSARIAWNAVPNPAEYRLYKNGSERVRLPGTVREYIDYELDPGIAASYTVQAYWNVGGVLKPGVMSTPRVVTPPGAAPTGITGTIVSNNPRTMTVKWNAVTNASKYKVYFEGRPDVEVSAADPRSVTYYDLDPNTVYQVRVSAIWTPNVLAVGQVPREGIVSTIVNARTTAPAPGNLVATNITNTSARLSWNTVSTADEYRLYRDGGVEVARITVTGTETRAVVVDDLIPGRTVNYTVQAYWLVGGTLKPGLESTPRAVTPPGAAPSGLKGTVSNADPKKMTVTWNAAPNAYKYTVFFEGRADREVLATAARSLVYEDLDPNTIYQIQVSASWDPDKTSSDINRFREGNRSTIVNAKTAGPAPTGIVTVANSLKNTEAKIKWSAVSTADGYIIKKDGKEIARGAYAGLEYHDTTLRPGTTVRYTVHAYWVMNGNDIEGNPSIALAVTPPGAVPGNAKAKAINPTTIEVTWDGVTNATHYNVYLDNELVTVERGAGLLADRTYRFKDLKPNTTYAVRVSAVFDAGVGAENRYREGNIRANINVKTTGPAPGNFKSNDVSGASVRLTWTLLNDPDVVFYRVTRTIGSEVVTFYVLPAEYNTAPVGYVDSTLKPGEQAKYQVQAFWDGAGNKPGNMSTTVTVNTPNTAPTGLKVTANTPTTLTVTWNALPTAAGVRNYNLYLRDRDSNNALVGFMSPLATADRTVTFTGLHPNNNYQVVIEGEWAIYGGSTRLGKQSLLNAKTAGPAPTGLVRANLTSNSVHLNWNEINDVNLQGYRIIKNGERLTDITVAQYRADPKGFTDREVHPGVPVRYSVHALWYWDTADHTDKKLGLPSAALAFTPPGAAPGGVKAIVNSPTAITATWNAVPNVAGATVTGYNVYLYSGGVEIENDFVAVTGTRSKLFVGLDPNTQYQVRVAAEFDVGANPDPSIYTSWVQNKQGPLSAIVNAKTTGPAPGGLKANDITVSSVRLSWNPVNDHNVVGYRITRITGTDATTIVTTNITADSFFQDANSWIDDTLKPGIMVRYTVQALWEVGGVDKPGVLAAVNVTPGGTAPAGVKAVVNSPMAVTVTWNAVAGVSSYKVELISRNTNTVVDTKNVSASDPRSWQFTGLGALSPHAVRVTGVWTVNSADLEGRPSANVNFTSTGPAPTGLKANNITGPTVRLTWNMMPGAYGYVVYRTGVLSPTSTVFEKIGSITAEDYAAANGYKDETLTPGTAVRYQVRAYWYNSNNIGNASAALAVNPPGAAPTGVKVVADSPSRVTVTWNAVPGVSYYLIHNPIAGSAQRIEATAARSWQFTRLEGNKTYEFYVVGVWKDGTVEKEGKPSPTQKIGPLGPAPTNLRVAEMNMVSGNVTLTWSPVEGAVGYLVYQNGLTIGTYITSSEPRIALGVVTPGTTAKFTVVAYYFDGVANWQGAHSPALRVTNPNPAP